MNRRAILKTFVFASAGFALLPACMHDKGKASFLLKNIDINGDQEKLLAELAETIIPKTGTPGAKDLSSHLFMMMMVDDCYSKEDQQKFTKGLADFEALTQKRYGKTFAQLDAAQKKQLLTDVEANMKLQWQLAAAKNGKPVPADKATPPANTKQLADITTAVNDFYGMAKRLTVQSFTSSQYYLTKVQVYEMVPGRYHGCVPLKNA